MKKKIRVLVVDDSAVVRETLKDIISSDRTMEVYATASDPLVAANKIRKEAPDVITLDLEMPRMDGLTFLKKIMEQHPIPVVICSSLTGHGSDAALKALDAGAVDVIQKPRQGAKKFLEESKIRICDAVKAASHARLKSVEKKKRYIKKKAKEGTRTSAAMNEVAVTPKLTADVIIAKPRDDLFFETTEKVVAVGASTGGTEALRVLLEALPYNAPGMVVVQHMPEHFTSAFSRRLDGLCSVSVKEAADNDTVYSGRVLIAPGNKHTLLKRSGTRYYVEVKEGPLVCRHRPSVDVLFRSVARYAGKNAIGVIMTGMGDDGARGMVEMYKMNGYNIAQDEATCIVFGMPNEALKRGGVHSVMPLEAIAGEIMRISAQRIGTRLKQAREAKEHDKALMN